MKKFISILLTVMLLVAMSIPVFASTTVGPITSLKAPGSNGITRAGSKALGYVQWFGYALAIGMIIYIGIKYMMASANEKADLKKGAINYVIGAVLVAGASAIVGVLSSIGTSITSGT